MLQRTDRTDRSLNHLPTQTQLLLLAWSMRVQPPARYGPYAPRRLVPKGFVAERIGVVPLVHHRLAVDPATGKRFRQPYIVQSPVIYARRQITAKQMARRIMKSKYKETTDA